MVTATHIQSVSSPTIREKDLQVELSVFSYGKQHHGQTILNTASKHTLPSPQYADEA